MAETLNPYDVGALEKSLNDSATRVSTIWVSYLIFALYLLTAAATVSHRQLFLDEPFKLPVLNMELPLWGFSFIAPALLVIFHVYVLLQVLLLGRTAAAYNDAIARADLDTAQNVALRQRLANTLLVQIFAGSPREREGWLGFLLTAMAWITLAIAPIFILLVFQFSFLPYHSPFTTWMHRLLILAELAAFFLIWPLALDPRRDLSWSVLREEFKHACAWPWRLLRPPTTRRKEWQWLRGQVAPAIAAVLYVIVSLSVATFPGEWHVNLFTLNWPRSVQCERLIQREFTRENVDPAGAAVTWLDLRFDRLVLPRVDVVDDEKLDKIAAATKKAGEADYQGERTRILRGRDLNCGDFSDFADLRRIDLTGAQLTNASFIQSKLQGATLRDAQLQGASLRFAQLQGASLFAAQLRDASLFAAQLQGASLNRAQLQGASLFAAALQGASLDEAQLQGASLDRARLQGASLDGAQLQGASLREAQLQGASLFLAHLQGATLADAQLQGASLDSTQLQGADLVRSSMAHTPFSDVRVWRAQIADCGPSRVNVPPSRVNRPKSDPIVSIISVLEGPDKLVRAEPDDIAAFIARSVAVIPNTARKEAARRRMSAGLDLTKGDTAAIAALWSECEVASSQPTPQEFDRKFDQDRAEFLRELICDDTQNGKAVAKGVIYNLISDNSERREFSTQLARGLLGEDGKPCPGAKGLDARDEERLRRFAPASAPAPTSAPIHQ